MFRKFTWSGALPLRDVQTIVISLRAHFFPIFSEYRTFEVLANCANEYREKLIGENVENVETIKGGTIIKQNVQIRC